jgi:two-component system nitrogen regulation sensor histidine kinase GlnL
MSVDAAPALDQLATPVLWLGADGRIVGANPACARWLGVSLRRLPGLPLAALEAEGDALAQILGETGSERDFARLRRVPMAFPGTDIPRFADLLLSRREGGGWWLEAQPVEEFPGEDPAVALPSALSAALKGLAHELRNPLAGLKGAAQLLARRTSGDPTSRELTGLI